MSDLGTEQPRQPATYSPPPGVVPDPQAPTRRIVQEDPEPAFAAPPPAAAQPAPVVAPVSSLPGPLQALLPAGTSTTTLAIYGGLALAGVIALVVGWQLFSSAATRDTDQRLADANKAIAQVSTDQARIGDKVDTAFTPLKGPDVATKVPTADSVRRSIDAVKPQLDESSKLVDTDHGLVNTATSRVNDRGVLNLLNGDRLDKESARLQALSNALDVRTDEITTARQQLQLLDHLTTAEEHFDQLAEALQHQDVATANALYNPANDAMNQAVVDAQQQNTPDAARQQVDQLSNLFQDTKAVINSITNRDYGGIDASLRAFDVHLANLRGMDPNAVRNGYDDLVKTFKQRYESEMKAAGLAVNAGKPV